MNRKIKKIGKAVLACLPVLVLLACGAMQETDGLKELFEKQDGGIESGKLSEGMDGSGSPALEEDGQEEQTAFVHICGEVVSPGVYEVEAGSRICDVLLLAGGFSEEAEQGSVNLAAVVEDGMQIVIPSKAEAAEEKERLKLQREGMVNINKASVEQLCSLPGIGESRAAAIVAYREKQGGFQTKEEIMQVTGIKEGMYEKIKDSIYIE